MWSLLLACSGPDATDGPPPPPTDTPTDPDPTGDTGAPPPPPPPPGVDLVINEVMVANDSTVNGPDGHSFPDWVEIANVGEVAVDLARLGLENQDHDAWSGAGLEGRLRPGERLVLWCGAAPRDPGDGIWTGFSLDQDNEELELTFDGEIELDEVEVDPLGDDVAFARTPDLSDTWAATAWPTPGAENGPEPSPTLDVADATVFTKDRVHEIVFEMGMEAYQRLSAYERPEVTVGFSFDGAHVDEIGLKLKGSASYDTMQGKPAFIVDVNQVVPTIEFRGLKAFRLHNGKVLDPTRVRDHLSYSLAREVGLMAPRVGWAHVVVRPLGGGPDVDYGIYMLIERHDRAMIRYHHPDQVDTAVVYEPNETEAGGWGGGDFGTGSYVTWDQEEGPRPLDAESAAAMAAVDRIVTGSGGCWYCWPPPPPDVVTDEQIAELWTHADPELVLTYLAWERVVMHTDGYMAPNNWRVYVDGDTHLVSLMPSGAEWTWDAAAPGEYFNGRLGNFCFGNPGCERAFAERLIEVADAADALDLPTEFRTISELLDPFIDSDPRFSSWVSVADSRRTTDRYLRDNPASAREWAWQRFPDLRP